MRIGELATQCDCPVETIRYYEKINLLAKPSRSENGYRFYTDDHLQWLHFILRCRRVGLNQNEIRKLVNVATNQPARCDEINDLLAKHLLLLRHKLSSLKQMETAIVRLKEKCADGTLNECPVITELMKL